MAGAKDVVIRISATDAASPTFRRIAGDAKAMGAQVSSAAAQGEQGLDRLNKRAAAMGAAIGSASLILGEFSRAAAQDEANQARLQQAVENTGKSYDDYSEAIERAIKIGQEKAFSDDDTREALVRLNAVTNDTGKSLDQLSLVMDFARQRGISLADSAGIIAKVMGGNVSILQRYGLALEDGATATEALALVQQRSAGQADAYADSQLGNLDRMKDKWGELAESIGASTGELQSFLMLLPGLTAGYTAIAAIVAGLGGVPVVAAAAALGGAGYLAYDVFANGGNAGPNTSDTLFGGLGSSAAGLVKKITPGSYGDSLFNDIQSQYQGIINENTIEQIIAQMFWGVSTEAEVKTKFASLIDKGAIPDMKLMDLPAYAKKLGLTVQELIAKAAVDSGSMLGDTGQYMTPYELLRRRFALNGGYDGPQPGIGYTPAPAVSRDPYNGQGIYNPFRLPNAASDGYTNRDLANSVPTYASGGSGAVANSLSGIGNAPIVLSDVNQAKAAAANADALTAALREQLGAFAAVEGGITSTTEALSVFQATQNTLSSEMNTYQAQASEWTSELSAQEAAYKILEERQAAGAKLTQEQTQFMEQYAHATEVGTAAVEDSTVSAGIAAQNMLLNKEAMDTFKTSADSFTASIDALTLALGGIPPNVETEIRLTRAGDDIDAYLAELSKVPSSITTVLNTVTGGGVTVPGGGYYGGDTPYGMNGLTMNAYAGGGTVYGGNHALVGERGPELVWLPNGAQVMNTEGTKSRLQAGRKRASGGVTYNNYGPVTLAPPSVDTYGAISASLMGGVF